MGRRKLPDHLKKKPNDYPQLAFRVSEEDKRKLLRAVADLAEVLNRTRSQEDPYWTNGDVFVKAMYLGLKQLKKS